MGYQDMVHNRHNQQGHSSNFAWLVNQELGLRLVVMCAMVAAGGNHHAQRRRSV
jgi:hypothetical protein